MACFLSVFEHLPCSLQILFLARLFLGQDKGVECILAHPAFAESQMLLVLTDAEYRLVTGLILPGVVGHDLVHGILGHGTQSVTHERGNTEFPLEDCSNLHHQV